MKKVSPGCGCEHPGNANTIERHSQRHACAERLLLEPGIIRRRGMTLEHRRPRPLATEATQENIEGYGGNAVHATLRFLDSNSIQTGPTRIWRSQIWADLQDRGEFLQGRSVDGQPGAKESSAHHCQDTKYTHSSIFCSVLERGKWPARHLQQSSAGHPRSSRIDWLDAAGCRTDKVETSVTPPFVKNSGGLRSWI